MSARANVQNGLGASEIVITGALVNAYAGALVTENEEGNEQWSTHQTKRTTEPRQAAPDGTPRVFNVSHTTLGQWELKVRVDPDGKSPTSITWWEQPPQLRRLRGGKPAFIWARKLILYSNGTHQYDVAVADNLGGNHLTSTHNPDQELGDGYTALAALVQNIEAPRALGVAAFFLEAASVADGRQTLAAFAGRLSISVTPTAGQP